MYKLAFIGGSVNSIAGYPHFIASQMDRRFEVVAAAFSSDSTVNRQTASQWKIKNVYNDYKELILQEKNNIDAVVILTPTPLHCEIIIELIKYNIPIICEKPLVSSIEEIKEIEKVYESTKHFLVVTNNYSGYPMLRELQHKISNKELGDILHIRLKMPQESFLRPPKSVRYPQKWRLTDGFIPMISLDLGAHLHHLAYFLLQEEPNKVMATYDSFSKYDVVDDVNMRLEYKSGIKGNMWLSKTALGNRNGLHIEVYGSKASALWHQENPEKLEFSYSTGQKVITDRGSDIEMLPNHLYSRMTPGHPAGFIESFANLYNDIANQLDNFKKDKKINSRYVYSFEHAKNGIHLLHSATISHNKKIWIDII
ncbi:MAG: oxidoreductase [Sulfurimonas sp.]|nr:MAG: oxidoreductase [Sulfurimonas sp.]